MRLWIYTLLIRQVPIYRKRRAWVGPFQAGSGPPSLPTLSGKNKDVTANPRSHLSSPWKRSKNNKHNSLSKHQVSLVVVFPFLFQLNATHFAIILFSSFKSTCWRFFMWLAKKPDQKLLGLMFSPIQSLPFPILSFSLTRHYLGRC